MPYTLYSIYTLASFLLTAAVEVLFKSNTAEANAAKVTLEPKTLALTLP